MKKYVHVLPLYTYHTLMSHNHTSIIPYHSKLPCTPSKPSVKIRYRVIVIFGIVGVGNNVNIKSGFIQSSIFQLKKSE